jgi:hypothetical protein
MPVELIDGVPRAVVHPVNPWDKIEYFDLPKEEAIAWLAQQREAEITRIKAEREARFQSETDDLHWQALELEKSGQDSSAAWKEWITAKEEIRKELPYPE